MKGSVRKRYNNAWSYRIDLGFVDGKRRQVEKGGFKSECFALTWSDIDFENKKIKVCKQLLYQDKRKTG